MISLHSILATGLVDKLPTFILAAAAILITIAFSMGFVKGFRKVGWGGLIWATAAVLLTVVGLAAEPTGTPTHQLIVIMAVVLIYVAVTMIAYGILAYFVRPKIKWIKDNVNGDTSLAEYGLEFEPEYADYDGEDDPKPYGKRLHKTGCNPPNLFGRLLGGVACALNMGLLLWACLSFVLLCIQATGLADMVIGQILLDEKIAKLLEIAKQYVLDWLSIGLIIAVARVGYKKGLLNSLRGFIVSTGSLVLVVVCFYLPFSKYATQDTGLLHFLVLFINRCTKVVSKAPFFPDVIGKLLAGACLSLIAGAIMFGVNMLLKKGCKLVSSNASSRKVDQVLSCALYMLIGVFAVICAWMVLALANHFGLFRIHEIIFEDAQISNILFNFTKGLVKDLLPGV